MVGCEIERNGILRFVDRDNGKMNVLFLVRMQPDGKSDLLGVCDIIRAPGRIYYITVCGKRLKQLSACAQQRNGVVVAAVHGNARKEVYGRILGKMDSLKNIKSGFACFNISGRARPYHQSVRIVGIAGFSFLTGIAYDIPLPQIVGVLREFFVWGRILLQFPNLG